jgi:predicted NAD/FAD-dependent oxidoreductase
MPTAIIVGAGLAGLSAAQVLGDAGWHVRLLDKGKAAGGRLAARWFGDRTRRCDTGAQFLSVRDPAFARAVTAWEGRGWVRRWCHGIPLLDADRLHDGQDGHPRWLGVGGMDGLAERLAEGLDLRQPATVTGVRPAPSGWTVTWVPGDAVRGTASGPPVEEHADAVILTQPAPQVVHLLAASGLPLPEGLVAVRYDPCVAVVVDLPQATGPLLADPGAVRIDDPASPLSWVASARGRGQLDQGELLLLHARGEWSAAHLDHPLATLTDELLAASAATLARLGIQRDLSRSAAEARVWRYSRCVAPCSAPFLRVAAGTAPLLIAGDGFGGCPRVEGAWLSGRAAALLMRGPG